MTAYLGLFLPRRMRRFPVVLRRVLLFSGTSYILIYLATFDVVFWTSILCFVQALKII